VDEQLRGDLEHVRQELRRRAAARQGADAVDQLKEINVRDIVTWVVMGLAAVTFVLAQDALSDVARLVEKLDDKVDNHLLTHPDRELDKRLTLVESHIEGTK